MDQVSRLQARIDQLETQAAARDGTGALPDGPISEQMPQPLTPQNG
jgi:hypothetical protein